MSNEFQKILLKYPNGSNPNLTLEFIEKHPEILSSNVYAISLNTFKI